LSPINAKNLAALTLTFILAACILGPAASADGGPEHPIGSGPEDWWIAYPDQHSNAGSSVDHQSWTLDPLAEKPVIVLIHRIGCPACVSQEAEIKKVLGDLGDEVTYLDVLAENDYGKTWSGLEVYDPNGNPRLVPVTVFLTLVPGPDGDADVAWHSATGHRDERWIRSYLNDAIALHDENSASWDR
jgi:hypothetical protein